jgi:hypothetical protein
MYCAIMLFKFTMLMIRLNVITTIELFGYMRLIVWYHHFCPEGNEIDRLVFFLCISKDRSQSYSLKPWLSFNAALK